MSNLEQRETCLTTLTCVANCKVGMVVRHIFMQGKTQGNGIGTVTAIGTDGVHIHFADDGLDAIYDDDWFRCAREAVRLELWARDARHLFRPKDRTQLAPPFGQ